MRFPRSLATRFRPEKLLGAGGFGAVFLAEDLVLGRKVAIKLLLQGADPVARERFLREAAGLAVLKHRSLPTVYCYGETEEGPYLAEEYVPGVPLSEAGEVADPVGVMLQVAEALEEVHAQGFVHRDVKLGNIVLAANGRAVLVDFGLAYHGDLPLLTRTAKVVGTMGYVAPEILAYQRPGPAADWYSWGVTFYALMERRLPFHHQRLALAARRGLAIAPRFRKLDPDSGIARLLTAVLQLDPSVRPTGTARIRELLGMGREALSSVAVPAVRIEVPSTPPAPVGTAGTGARRPVQPQAATLPRRVSSPAPVGVLGSLARWVGPLARAALQLGAALAFARDRLLP